MSIANQQLISLLVVRRGSNGSKLESRSSNSLVCKLHYHIPAGDFFWNAISAGMDHVFWRPVRLQRDKVKVNNL